MAEEKKKTKINIALIGAGSRGYSILQLLREVGDVNLVGVADIDKDAPGIKFAKKLGVKTTTNFLDLLGKKDLDLIIEVTGDPSVRQVILEKKSTTQAGLLGTAGAELIWDLLKAKQKGKKQERLYTALRIAYEKIRQHEKELKSSKRAVEEANIQLEKRLAEIFFMHEFFKALASCSTVNEVTKLIADGANGILGTEVSCVYLWDEEDKAYMLGSWRGRDEKLFKKSIKSDDSIITQAGKGDELRAVLIRRSRISLESFLKKSQDVPSQVAVPLMVKNEVLGVLGIASPSYRVLTTEDQERLISVAYMSSLALQNALFNQELEMLSVTDRLTGLYNYGYFHQHLEEELKRAKRFKRPLSLIMLDIDHFKEFNDKFGHLKGDVVLKKVADVLKANTRDIDTVVRYGGEEFALILPETVRGGAVEVGERICELIARTGFEVDNSVKKAKETVSLGVASYPENASTKLDLIERADEALYEAKRRGRNRVVATAAVRGRKVEG